MKAVVTGPNREGRQAKIDAWGWSDTSPDEARVKAEERAWRQLARLPFPEQRGKREVYYEGNPFREPVLQDLSRGAMKAVVTRNSIGCEVLNVDSVAFADLDYEPPRRGAFEALFDFGGKKLKAHRQTWDEQELGKMRDWQRANPSWTFRVYRTAGGYRVLVVSHPLAAGTTAAAEWLKAMDSDPLYQKLCRNQKSFRARLTPKPYRCNTKKPPVRFPWDTPRAQEQMDKWIAGYAEKSGGHAVCELAETIGGARPHPDIAAVLALHDEKTRVGSGLPLA